MESDDRADPSPQIVRTMSMILYWAYLVVFLYHQAMSLQPNYCEFFDEVFEYVPQTVIVQERKERRKEGIVTALDPRKLLDRGSYRNVTRTEMVAVKRMRSYVSCCLGFVKFEGQCIPKSGPSTPDRLPTPTSSLQPRSSSSSMPSVSVSKGTVSSSTAAAGKVVSSVGGSKTMDEVVTEDQREAATPAAIRLNQRNPLVNDELEIPGAEAEVDQTGMPTALFIGR